MWLFVNGMFSLWSVLWTVLSWACPRPDHRPYLPSTLHLIPHILHNLGYRLYLSICECLMHMGASWPLRTPKKHFRWPSTPWGPKMEPKSSQNQSGSLPKFWVWFYTHFVTTWLQLGGQNPPQIDPSWTKVDQKRGQDVDNFLVDFLIAPGRFFGQFVSKLESWEA